MIMALELIICGGLIALGASLWWWVERRTERRVAAQHRETERWRQAYTDLRLELTQRGVQDSDWAPLPLPLQLNEQDMQQLHSVGRTAKKRIRTDSRGLA